MSDPVARVASVVLPERNTFFVCLPEGLDPAAGTACLVRLDYGEDVARVKATASFDPARHGGRIPGFALVRETTAADEAILDGNRALASSMAKTFQACAAAAGQILNVAYARLSFGQNRLFLRYTGGEGKLDLTHPMAEIRRLFKVSLNVWPLGPRDAVALFGALGACGRASCCSTWQTRYPQGLTAERAREAGVAPGAQNGVCGRFKCCLAFEEAAQTRPTALSRRNA